MCVDINIIQKYIKWCLNYFKGDVELSCAWTGFVEEESEVQFFSLGVGATEGNDDVLQFFTLAHDVFQYTLQR